MRLTTTSLQRVLFIILTLRRLQVSKAFQELRLNSLTLITLMKTLTTLITKIRTTLTITRIINVRNICFV